MSNKIFYKKLSFILVILLPVCIFVSVIITYFSKKPYCDDKDSRTLTEICTKLNNIKGKQNFFSKNLKSMH